MKTILSRTTTMVTLCGNSNHLNGLYRVKKFILHFLPLFLKERKESPLRISWRRFTYTFLSLCVGVPVCVSLGKQRRCRRCVCRYSHDPILGSCGVKSNSRHLYRRTSKIGVFYPYFIRIRRSTPTIYLIFFIMYIFVWLLPSLSLYFRLRNTVVIWGLHILIYHTLANSISLDIFTYPNLTWQSLRFVLRGFTYKI